MATANNRNQTAMSRDDLIRELFSLNPEQAFVLYHRISGVELSVIANMMSVSNRTVQAISGQLNIKFKVQKKDTRELRARTFTLMSKYAIPTKKWLEWEWPTEKLVEDFNKLHQEVETDQPFEPEKKSPKPSQNQHENRVNIPIYLPKETWQDKVQNLAKQRLWQISAFVAVIILFVVFINLFRTPIKNHPTPAISPTFSPIPTTYTVAPELPTLFSDDFQNGWSDKWQILSGRPLVVNGNLTSDQSTWMVVGDKWKNFRMEMDWSNGTYDTMIGLRYNNFEDTVYMWSNGSWYWWQVGTDTHKKLPGSDKLLSGNGAHGTHLTFLVQGNKYSLLVNGDFVSSVVVVGNSEGQIALRLDEGSQIGNLKVYELP